MGGDDAFAFAAGYRLQHLAGAFAGAHLDPGGDGIGGASVQGAAIVHAADVADDEAGAEQGELDADGAEFGSDGIGESAQGEFAHGVGRSRGSGCPTGNAADDGEIALAFLEFGESGVKSAQDAEDVSLELAAIIVEGKLLEIADYAEAGIGEDDVELAVLANSGSNSAFELAVAGYVTHCCRGLR